MRDLPWIGFIIMFLFCVSVVLFFTACAPDKSAGQRDQCFGSGGAHYVYDATTNTGQCVYDAPGAK